MGEPMIDERELALRWAPTLHLAAAREQQPSVSNQAVADTAPRMANIPVTAIPDSQSQPLVEGDSVARAKAFVTTLGRRTYITGPAASMGETAGGVRQPTVEEIAADPMLTISGRFVGGEEPNRNNAFWSAGDLELSAARVAKGPLNWLHEARHIIGSITSADYVAARTPEAAEEDGAPSQPHITATAGIWRWIYPDEAYVVQNASDQNMLWYSMECISGEVACAGEAGCGNTTTYAAYLAGSGCDHIRERSTVRHFKNPTFLGGAVIVPPARPGWANADVKVMKTAQALAETAFESAGRPDIPASTWEQMMGQLVRFGGNTSD
jgi:hypothetical protein